VQKTQAHARKAHQYTDPNARHESEFDQARNGHRYEWHALPGVDIRVTHTHTKTVHKNLQKELAVSMLSKSSVRYWCPESCHHFFGSVP